MIVASDFRLFKELKLRIDSKGKADVDTGYTRIPKFHANSVIPVKRSKKKPLTKTDKLFNRRVSSERVLNEQVNRLIKRFKIVSDCYRNRRKRFSSRFNLICGICNVLFSAFFRYYIVSSFLNSANYGLIVKNV